jgi:hypothetical protein
VHYRNKNKLFSLFLLAENHTSLRVIFYFSLAKVNNSQVQDLRVAKSKVTKTMVAESIVTKTMVPNSFQRNYGAEFFPKLWFRILSQNYGSEFFFPKNYGSEFYLVLTRWWPKSSTKKDLCFHKRLQSIF